MCSFCCGDQRGVGRSAAIFSILFPLLRGGALILILALGLAFASASVGAGQGPSRRRPFTTAAVQIDRERIKMPKKGDELG